MASSKVSAAARRGKRVLTIKAIENVKPREKRFELADAGLPGFYLSVMPSGHRSFVFRFRFHGQPRKLTLGAHPR